jgi:hypothetical protein
MKRYSSSPGAGDDVGDMVGSYAHILFCYLCDAYSLSGDKTALLFGVFCCRDKACLVSTYKMMMILSKGNKKTKYGKSGVCGKRYKKGLLLHIVFC